MRSCVRFPWTCWYCLRCCNRYVCCCSSSLRLCSEFLARFHMDCMSSSRPVQPTFTQIQIGPSFLHCWSALVLERILPLLLVITAKTKTIKVCYITSFKMVYESFRLVIVMLYASGCHKPHAFFLSISGVINTLFLSVNNASPNNDVVLWPYGNEHVTVTDHPKASS